MNAPPVEDLQNATFTQDTLDLRVTTPLGDGKFLLLRFDAMEALSEPFHATLELQATDDAVDFTQLLGQPMTVHVPLVDDGSVRHYSGICTRIAQAESDSIYTTYVAELRPSFWLLSLDRDCVVYQNQSIPDIVRAALVDGGLASDALEITTTGTYEPLELCVRYDESTMTFVARLLEQAGLFYFVRHEEESHVLVIADDVSAFTACPGPATLRLGSSGPWDQGADLVERCRLERQLVAGKYAAHDYNFTTPATSLLASVDGANADAAALARAWFEYPAGHLTQSAGEGVARRRLEALESAESLLHGDGTCRGLGAGGTFTLSRHPRDEVNTSYYVVRATHHATQDTWRVRFVAAPGATAFRAPRRTPRPRIPGPQTAVVVGPPNEETHTDQYGRVKVKFRWDRVSPDDDTASCWIRVAQGWAGGGWGSFFLPRVGQEVVVSFLDGDPDRPLVTGGVYNASNAVPLSLPTDKAKSVIRTRSTPQGDAGNELRFDDTKGSESLFLHAQKDMTVEVLGMRTTSVTQNDKRTVTGNEQLNVTGTRTITTTGDETHTNEAKLTHTISGDYELTVSGNLTIKCDGAITFQAGTSSTVKSGTGLTIDAGTSLDAKAGTSANIEATANLTVKGAMGTVEASGPLALKGAVVQLN